MRVFTNEKPRGNDRWYPIQPGGWLIRNRGKHRQRCLHPLHRSCPVDSIRFEPVRFTVIFYEEEGRSKKKVIKDDWTGTPTGNGRDTRSSNSKINLKLPPHSWIRKSLPRQSKYPARATTLLAAEKRSLCPAAM